MMRFSSNTLRTSFEAGTTSNWLLTFENVPNSKVQLADRLNLIKQAQGGNFFPAQDIDYNQVVIEEKVIEVGPSIKIHIPVFAEPPTEMTITYFETHKKEIKNILRTWVDSTELNRKRAPANLKDIAMKVIVWYFDKELNDLKEYSKDVYYVVLKGSLSTRGDQEFALDTNVLNLAIIGTE